MNNILKNKQVVILAFAIVIVIIIIFLVLILKTGQPRQFDTNPVPASPTPYNLLSNPDVSYKVTYTDPKNQAKDINLDRKIIIKFNQPVNLNEMKITVNPEFKYDQKISGTILTLTPIQNLNPATTYVITFLTKTGNKLIDVLVFTTKGTTAIEPKPDKPDIPTDFKAEKDQYELISAPDVYLRNKTPYSTESFSISSYFDKKTSDYGFVVQYLNIDSTVSQADFYDWLHSIKLTDEQIAKLNFVFE